MQSQGPRVSLCFATAAAIPAGGNQFRGYKLVRLLSPRRIIFECMIGRTRGNTNNFRDGKVLSHQWGKFMGLVKSCWIKDKN